MAREFGCRRALLAALAIVVAACGNDSSPLAPRATAPTLRGPHTSPNGKWRIAPVDAHSLVALTSVSCATKSFCMGVDRKTGLATSWNGTTWSAPTAVDPSNHMTALSCPSARVCKAVDDHGNVVSWNGSSWSKPLRVDIAPKAVKPTARAAAFELPAPCSSDTSCRSSRAALAGGRWMAGPSRATVVAEAADGTPSFTAVSCPTEELCMAVDNQGNMLSWDGVAWTPPLAIETDGTAITAVSCADAQSCVAVDGQGRAIAWNGLSWNLAKTVDGSRALTSVSCPLPSFCMAVDSNGEATALSGASWSAPATIDSGASLTAVSCPAATSCVAVDNQGDSLTWDGSSWSAPVAIADGGASLPTVSCAVPSICEAADTNGNTLEGPA